MTSDELLFVLNELEPVDLADLTFCVITRGSHHRWDNFAQTLVHTPEETFWPFDRAEVLVISKTTGREPLGGGRKPGKWGVSFELFGTLADAQARREAVLASQPHIQPREDQQRG